MTPRENANELFEKFYQIGKNHDFDYAKECALIAVDEILNIDNIKPYILHKEIIEYWQEVKQEIKKL